MRRVLLGLLVLLTLAGVGLFVLLGVGAWMVHDQPVAGAFSDDGLARLRADRARLEALALFPVGVTSDAGPTLNPQLRWGDDGGAPWNAPEQRERLQTWNATWLDHAADVDDIDT